MRRLLLALILALGIIPIAQSQSLSSPYSIATYKPQTFTATGQTGIPIALNGLTSGNSTVGSSFASGNITVTGNSLTNVTFGVQGSSDNGVTYFALPISNVSVPTASLPSTTVIVTGPGLYQIGLAGLTHVRFVTSGTFSAGSLTLQLSGSPNATARTGSGPGGGSVGPQGPPGCLLGSTCTSGFTGTLLSAFSSLQDASNFCSGLGAQCDLVIDKAYTNTTPIILSANTNLRCVQNGLLTINSGANVTVNSGNVYAPAGQQCFAGAGSLAGLKFAMPDWFATPSGGSYPTEAISRAYNATVAGAEIKFSIANYLNTTYTHTGTSAIFSPRWWHGAGMPRVDQIGTASGPQRFVDGSGTVIQGEFVVLSSDTTLSDFGVDYGAWVIANKFGGAVPFPQNGLQAIANGNSGTAGKNMVWRNLASLVVAQSSAHTSLMENYLGCSADNIWDYQPVPVGATAGWGFIDKSAYCTYSNIHVFGAAAGGVYSKADHGSRPNGASHNNVWSNVVLTSAVNAPDAGRFLIHGSGGDSNYGSEVSGLSINDTAAGIQDVSDGGGTVSGWKFSNVTMTNMYGAAFFLNFMTDMSVSHYSVSMNAEDTNGVVYIGPAVARPKFYDGRITASSGDVFIIRGTSNANNGGVIDGMYLDGTPFTGVTMPSSGTGTVSGWSIRNWKSVNHDSAPIYALNADNLFLSNIDVQRLAFDVNGAIYLGSAGTHYFLRDIITRGVSGQPIYGIVSYANSALVDHFECFTCDFTAVSQSSTPSSLIVNNLYWTTTPTHGTAPYYTFGNVVVNNGTGGTAGGDLAGTYPNPTVDGINGAAIPASAPCLASNASRQLTSTPCGTSSGGTVTGITSGNASPLFNTTVGGTASVPALSYTLTSQAANLFFASPDGTTGVGIYRKLVPNDLTQVRCVLNGYSPVNADGSIGSCANATNGYFDVAIASSNVDSIPTPSVGHIRYTVQGGLPVFIDSNGVITSLVPSTNYTAQTTFSFNGAALLLGPGSNSNSGITYNTRAAVGFSTGSGSGQGAALVQGINKSVCFTHSGSFMVADSSQFGCFDLATNRLYLGNSGRTAANSFWWAAPDGTMQVSAINFGVSSVKTSSYTALATDSFVQFDSSSNASSMTLNLEAVPTIGHPVTFVKMDTSTKTGTITPPAGYTINGAATFTVPGTQYKFVTVTCFTTTTCIVTGSN